MGYNRKIMIDKKYDLFDDPDFDDDGFFNDSAMLIPNKAKKNGRKERASRWR